MREKELAERVGVSLQTISHYEHGHSLPDNAIVRQLSQALQVPERFFQQPLSSPLLKTEQCFYRALSRTSASTRHHVEALSALFITFMDYCAEHFDLPTTQIPKIEEDPEVAALECRREWKLGNGPLIGMLALLERQGAWVTRLAPQTTDVDAFSFWQDGRPVVILNPTKNDPCRQRFDLAHELGHLVMHAAPEASRAQEGQAHRFAAAFLVPADAWKQEAPRSSDPRAYEASKRRWQVSTAALIRRSYDLEILNESQYKSAMVQISVMGLRKNEGNQDWLVSEQAELVAKYLRTLHRNGVSFSDICNKLATPSDLLRQALGDALMLETPSGAALGKVILRQALGDALMLETPSGAALGKVIQFSKVSSTRG